MWTVQSERVDEKVADKNFKFRNLSNSLGLAMQTTNLLGESFFCLWKIVKSLLEISCMFGKIKEQEMNFGKAQKLCDLPG